MIKQQTVVRYAILGFLAASIFWAYNAFGDYSRPMDRTHFVFTAILTVACPPSVLSIPFWETEPDTAPGIIIWLVIALLNSALYALIGVAARHLGKRNVLRRS